MIKHALYKKNEKDQPEYTSDDSKNKEKGLKPYIYSKAKKIKSLTGTKVC